MIPSHLLRVRQAGLLLPGLRAPVLPGSLAERVLWHGRQLGNPVKPPAGRTGASLPARLDENPVSKKQPFNMETWSQGGLRYFVIGDASVANIDSLTKLFKAAS